MELWQLWVDTGGTFTDALARDPAGRLSRVKVLSSSALRGRVAAPLTSAGPEWVRFEGLSLPAGFAAGASFRLLGGEVLFEAGVIDSTPAALRLEAPCPAAPGTTFELRFPEEAPVLAARLLTGAATVAALPALRVRLATTRGTNALLERKGAPTAFFTTRGFGDLLLIGNQQRPDLFALEIVRPAPLYSWAVEVEERLEAGGATVTELDLEALGAEIDALVAAGCRAAGVALMHGYLEPAHENRLADFLRRRGIAHVSASAALSPTIGILPRAETAVVDAYLSPVVGGYLERVGCLAAAPGSSLHVMSSAGGLLPAGALHPKDTLLSGPAGGVVGAAAAGRQAGFELILGFDMGGTSTDVSRFGGDFEYTFEHQVGGARVAAPALRIETVAAGGGSICRLDGGAAGTGLLKVGPESAGASPGPACYGAGGPLTLTDVNLLLGRLRPERFAIPIDRGAASGELEKIVAELPGSRPAELLLGFLEIANERMAEAMRRVSIRQGYDPAEHALVAFGGAGGQHACAIAELLDIPAVVLPVDAGLLSARGLGAARLERFAQRQVLRPLPGLAAELSQNLAELAASAGAQLAADGLPEGEIEIRRRLVFLRFLGQESALEIEIGDDQVGEEALAAAFRTRFEQIYGYLPQRGIEVVALRVVASERPASENAPDGNPPDLSITPQRSPRRRPGPSLHPDPDGGLGPGLRRGDDRGDGTCSTIFVDRNEGRTATISHDPFAFQEAFFGGAFQPVPCYAFDAETGATIDGPALLFDASASLVVEPGWKATRSPCGAWVARRG